MKTSQPPCCATVPTKSRTKRAPPSGRPRFFALAALALLGAFAWANWPTLHALPPGTVANRILVEKSQRKLTLLRDYLGSAPDPERGWALASITGVFWPSLCSIMTYSDGST